MQMQPATYRIFYQSHALTITYEEELGLGRATWQGKLSSHEMREALLLCMHAIEMYELKYWLADNRKLKYIPEEDQQWIKDHVVPTLVMGPLLKVATLLSEDVKSAEAVHLIYEGATETGHLQMQDFNREEEALQWLLSEA